MILRPVFLPLIALLLILQGETVFAQVVARFEIPSAPEFNPRTYFKSKAGKMVEVCYNSEGWLRYQFRKIVPEDVEPLRRTEGFTLLISEDSVGTKLSWSELFLAIMLLSESEIEIDSIYKTPFMLINNSLKGFLTVPASSVLDGSVSSMFYNKAGSTSWSAEKAPLYFLRE